MLFENKVLGIICNINNLLGKNFQKWTKRNVRGDVQNAWTIWLTWKGSLLSFENSKYWTDIPDKVNLFHNFICFSWRIISVSHGLVDVVFHIIWWLTVLPFWFATVTDCNYYSHAYIFVKHHFFTMCHDDQHSICIRKVLKAQNKSECFFFPAKPWPWSLFVLTASDVNVSCSILASVCCYDYFIINLVFHVSGVVMLLLCHMSINRLRIAKQVSCGRNAYSFCQRCGSLIRTGSS